MRRIIAGTVAAVAIAAAVPLLAGAGQDDGRGHGMHGHHGGEHHGQGMRGERRADGGPRARIRLTEMIETYDADDDGSVTQAEVDEWRANRLGEFDTDGDGQLSLDEYEQLWLDAMHERMVRHFQRHDRDGDGQVTGDEFGKRTSHLVMMRDRNEDGVLNLDDLRRGRRGAGPQGMMQGGQPAPVQPGAQQQEGTDPAGAQQQQ